MFHIGDDRPIFLRAKSLDLALAVHDQAQRHRLHPARRFRPGQLAPEHRRQRKANQIIQRPPRAIGIDQIHVEFARPRHRFGHRCFGDRVEGDALDQFGERLFVRQHFLHMPADRFAFAVRVGREDQLVRLLRLVCDRL